MFRIEIYERPIGGGHTPRLVKDNGGETFERAEAIRCIEALTARCAHFGYNGQQDHWWCRNDGDTTATMLVIRAH